MPTMTVLLLRWALRIMASRKPDFIIGNPKAPHIHRWWAIPRNKWFNVYVHLFKGDDSDVPLHDHPWLFNCSILVRGMYHEHVGDGRPYICRYAGEWIVRFPSFKHRITLSQPRLDEQDPVTIFITGPVVRRWGFYCTKGWTPFKDYYARRAATGNGCEQ